MKERPRMNKTGKITKLSLYTRTGNASTIRRLESYNNLLLISIPYFNAKFTVYLVEGKRIWILLYFMFRLFCRWNTVRRLSMCAPNSP